MTIEALVAAVPPPAAPFEAFRGPWEPVEAELGTTLPLDYKQFVKLYGNGHFMEFLGISVPRSTNPNTRLESRVPTICEAFSEFDDLPYPLWPSANGLFPFGATDNGDELFWVTDGDPSDWGVVVWDRGLQEFEALDCDLTGFLVGLETGGIQPKGFPRDLRVCKHLFQPSSRYVRYQLGWRVRPDGSVSSS